jgi:type II secretory pathway pseudopilin PulG
MRSLTPRPSLGPRSGIAILTVLLVLMALLALTAPFLLTTRNAAKASSQLSDAAQARLALDSAARLARSELARSHPSVDPTPWSDSEAEIGEWAKLDASVLDASDPHGVMWDASALDLAAEIDLSSAPPQLFANLLGASTRLDAALEPDAKEIAVASTSGFRDAGFLWIGRELIAYGERGPQGFKRLERGLGSGGAEGTPMPCGPQPAGPAAPGTPVIDQRAWAPVLWRLSSTDGEPRAYEAPEQLGDASRMALGGLDVPSLQALQEACTVNAGLRAGPRWQRGSRVLNAIQGGLDCTLVVDDARWFNPGTTVQITDGRTTELGVVQDVSPAGVRLMTALANDYLALAAVVRPQVRVPVNANTASAAVLEALFANLQLARVNSRITRDEARQLAALVIESRPFDGFEDFLRRVVLPAGGIEPLPDDAPVRPAALAGAEVAAVCSEQDAYALYVNALNANDSRLAYSTLPLCFTTRDTYALDLRSAVNAPNGAERASARREQLEVTVPQNDPLLALWARQEDLDDALRLTREAPLWTTGPSATSPGDDPSSPPSRARANFGPRADGVFDPALKLPPSTNEAPGTDEHVFASREETAWAQLAPARLDESGRRAGRALHFDHETRDLEGRFLPDGPEARRTTDPLVGWTPNQGGFLRALDLELWVKPRALADGILLDVGSTSLETDRVQLLFEGPDLVLRVLDAGGDHPLSALREAGEARYSIQPGGLTGGAGMEPDTWTHVAIDVAGTRPDQITLLVDGQAHGVRTPGRTRLVAALPDGGSMLAIEDDEGFPDRCVVRVGNELVECIKSGNNLFECSRITTGENAGFGGRTARVDYELSATNAAEPGAPVPITSGQLNTNHAAGTSVELYGYSLPLAGPVTIARGQTTSAVGVFAVGRLDSVVGGSQTQGDLVEVNTTDPQGVPGTVLLGYGLSGQGSAVTGLVLQPVDPGLAQQQVLDAFNPNGGYAVIVGTRVGDVTGANGATGNGASNTTGDPVGGVEVIRYTGHDATTLFISPAGRAALPSERNQTQRPHAFVAFWLAVLLPQGTPVEGLLNWETYVMPISLGVVGAQGFPPAVNGSEYAQITHPSDAELTEWVRYDTVLGNDLIRSGLDAFENLDFVLTGGQPQDLGGPLPPPPPPGGGGSGGTFAAVVAPPPTAASQAQGSSDWSPFMQDGGSALDEQWPVTYAARTALQFRGVAGTYPQMHPAGMTVVPTFRVMRMSGPQATPDFGMPGRHDFAFLFTDDPTQVGMPVHVHRAYRPNQVRKRGFTGSGQIPEVPMPGTPVVELEDAWLRQWTWVALEDGAPIATGPGSSQPNTSAWETRAQARLTMHPSGERPRAVDRVFVGGAFRGGGAIPPCTVDEVVFGSTKIGDNTQDGPAIQGGQFVLDNDLQPGGKGFAVQPQSYRVAGGLYASGGPVLAQLPQDAGLLRIGSEVMCYAVLDAQGGLVTLATDGRGLLGTVEEYHEKGSTVTFLEGWTVSVLAGGMGQGDSALQLADPEDFPPLGWLVRVGDELVHYTYANGVALEMPRFSSEPGRMDRRGGGIFRGRFGSVPAAHASGTPVILHPLRYSDRWADRADAPELAYFGFALDQPAAFVRSAFFDSEEPSSGAVTLEVLQRLLVHGEQAAPPWDGDPALKESNLSLFTEGRLESEGQPVARQADRVEWRAFARYQPGAFDAVTGASHGWKQTPRLRLLGAQYIAPGLVVRRVDR